MKERKLIFSWFILVSLVVPAGIGMAFPIVPLVWIAFAVTMSTLWSGSYSGLVSALVLTATYLSVSVMFAGLAWRIMPKR